VVSDGRSGVAAVAAVPAPRRSPVTARGRPAIKTPRGRGRRWGDTEYGL
jgi:hypothetical protein